MTELHSALVELIHDPGREKTKRQVLSLVRSLQDEGLNKNEIARGLSDVLLQICSDIFCDKGGTTSMMRDVAWIFEDEANRIDDITEAVIRNRKAGGDGRNYEN